MTKYQVFFKSQITVNAESKEEAEAHAKLAMRRWVLHTSWKNWIVIPEESITLNPINEHIIDFYDNKEFIVSDDLQSADDYFEPIMKGEI